VKGKNDGLLEGIDDDACAAPATLIGIVLLLEAAALLAAVLLRYLL
jgi:hypothetical protein